MQAVVIAGARVCPGSAAAADSVLKRFLSGGGADAVGMVDASEDTEIAGPQAIYAGEGDEVYLLDQVNGRVLGFDPKNAEATTRSFRLPAELQPTDLIVRHGQIMVWDGDIHVLRPTGPDDAPTRGLENHLDPRGGRPVHGVGIRPDGLAEARSGRRSRTTPRAA